MSNEPLPLDCVVEQQAMPLVRLQNDRLDQLIGRLLVPRQISVVYGSERGSLTLFAHVILVGGVVCNPSSKAFFLDSGNNYSPTLTRSLCPKTTIPESVLASIAFARVLSLDDVEDVITRISDTYQSVLVVIDSLSGVLNLTGAPGSQERARRLFAGLEAIRRAVNTSGMHVIMTDYITKDWSTGEVSPIGGNVLSHSIDTLIRIDPLEYPAGVLRLEVERAPMMSSNRSLLVRTTKRGLMPIQ